MTVYGSNSKMNTIALILKITGFILKLKHSEMNTASCLHIIYFIYENIAPILKIISEVYDLHL